MCSWKIIILNLIEIIGAALGFIFLLGFILLIWCFPVILIKVILENSY